MNTINYDVMLILLPYCATCTLSLSYSGTVVQ